MFRDEDCGLPGDYLVASTDTAKTPGVDGDASRTNCFTLIC
jgi:hypothetical protein